MSPPRIPRAPARGILGRIGGTRPTDGDLEDHARATRRDGPERLRRASEEAQELAGYAEQASARMLTLFEGEDAPRAIGVGQGALDVLCSRLKSTANGLQKNPSRTRLEDLGLALARGLRRFAEENGEGYRVQPLSIYVDAESLPDGTRRTVRDVLNEIAKLEGNQP